MGFYNRKLTHEEIKELYSGSDAQRCENCGSDFVMTEGQWHHIEAKLQNDSWITEIYCADCTANLS